MFTLLGGRGAGVRENMSGIETRGGPNVGFREMDYIDTYTGSTSKGQTGVTFPHVDRQALERWSTVRYGRLPLALAADRETG